MNSTNYWGGGGKSSFAVWAKAGRRKLALEMVCFPQGQEMPSARELGQRSEVPTGCGGSKVLAAERLKCSQAREDSLGICLGAWKLSWGGKGWGAGRRGKANQVLFNPLPCVGNLSGKHQACAVCSILTWVSLSVSSLPAQCNSSKRSAWCIADPATTCYRMC